MSFVKYLLTVPLKRKRFFIFALLVGFTLSCFLLLSDLNLDLVLKYSHRLPVLPTVQTEYRQILGKIANATSDELLVDKAREEPRIYTGSGGCIAAQGYQVYGANRPHADILANYSKVFSSMGWKAGDTRVDTETTMIVVDFIDPISPDYSTLGKGKYQTLYGVVVVYADPAIVGCFG